jgi:sensor histidine kinase YesM
MVLSFPGRYPLRYTILALTLYTAAFFSIVLFTDTLEAYGGLRGLAFFPLFAWLLRGKFFQKLFAFFLPLMLSMLLFSLVEIIAKLCMEHGTNEYYKVLTAATLTVFAGYTFILIKLRRPLFSRLFELGGSLEWAGYSLGILFSCILLMLFRFSLVNPVLYISFLLFIFWNFSVLCYAIINTHEKAKKSYEADFARSIISAGQSHYQKMNEMHDTLNILHHDYKHHLNTVSELANCGNAAEIKKYLQGLQEQMPKNTLQIYCSNSIVNALLESYAERCAKEKIKYEVQLDMPEKLPITNYDMCIILGNLLENAVEACCKLKEGEGEIKLTAKTQGEHFAVMAQNSFNGEIIEKAGKLASIKEDGGFGLRSIKAVAERYNGNVLTEWDNGVFTAYVMVRMQ